MESMDLTKLSSRGQVVLPQAIRRKLHLVKGEQLIVFCDNDSIILKKMERPVINRFKELLKESRAWAKKTGLSQADIKEAIRQVRAHKKSE